MMDPTLTSDQLDLAGKLANAVAGMAQVRRS
jgi:hypothetical protein